MRWGRWRRAAREAVSRNDHRNILAGAVAGLGGAIAIGAMEWFSLAAHYPLAVIPFATSIVLVIGSPEAEPAQPRALIGGHVVSALVGFAVLKLAGPQALAGAVLLTAFAWIWHRWVRRQPWPQRWV
jgi:CBS-domain-containing membrane protein